METLTISPVRCECASTEPYRTAATLVIGRRTFLDQLHPLMSAVSE
jgi:hypothetical protein